MTSEQFLEIVQTSSDIDRIIRWWWWWWWWYDSMHWCFLWRLNALYDVLDFKLRSKQILHFVPGHRL